MSAPLGALAGACLVASVVACAKGAGGSGAGADTGAGAGGATHSTSTQTTTTATGGSTSSSTSSGAAGSSNGLDPDLAPPDPGGQPCSQIGSESECPGIAVCRISSPSGGTCESCGPCGNLGATCAASSECDILFQCYQGHCTNLCPLGTSYCGAVSDCLDVGHATFGVCRP